MTDPGVPRRHYAGTKGSFMGVDVDPALADTDRDREMREIRHCVLAASFALRPPTVNGEKGDVPSTPYFNTTKRLLHDPHHKAIFTHLRLSRLRDLVEGVTRDLICPPQVFALHTAWEITYNHRRLVSRPFGSSEQLSVMDSLGQGRRASVMIIR